MDSVPPNMIQNNVLRPTVDIYNYRPLTVLQSMSALYTKLLNSRLAVVVEQNNLLGEIQNGFRKSR